MLERELTRILDIKEETDKKVIEAFKEIENCKQLKNRITVLSVFIFIQIYLWIQINYNFLIDDCTMCFSRSNWKVKIKW